VSPVSRSTLDIGISLLMIGRSVLLTLYSTDHPDLGFASLISPGGKHQKVFGECNGLIETLSHI
jgi:hypothetical protein